MKSSPSSLHTEKLSDDPQATFLPEPGLWLRFLCVHVARLEFPRETGLILSCAGKAGCPRSQLHPECTSTA